MHEAHVFFRSSATNSKLNSLLCIMKYKNLQMKRFLTLVLFALAFGFNAFAQDIAKNALGIRLGDNDGFGGELSYQRGLSKNNRAEFNLGFRNSKNYDAFKLTGLYQWVWNIEGGFNWYAGVGGGVGSYTVSNKFNDNNDSGVFAAVAGDIGIEYIFPIPLMISLDFRPEFYLGDEYRDNNFGSDIALSLRYRF